MKTAKSVMLCVAGVTSGIAVGVWMASMTYYCEFCLFAPARFATWQSCLGGSVASALVFGAIIALDREFLSTSFRALSMVSRFLFEDLTRR